MINSASEANEQPMSLLTGAMIFLITLTALGFWMAVKFDSLEQSINSRMQSLVQSLDEIEHSIVEVKVSIDELTMTSNQRIDRTNTDVHWHDTD